MKKLTFLLPILALAACGEEPAPEPVETVAPVEVVGLPAPTKEIFATAFGEACPDAEAVNVALCRRGMGAETAACEYGLGDDEYMRNDATLAVNEAGDGWMIQDPEAVCAQ
ncbi:hypothetical protein [Erythrobacter alti]|uniref:hypothetical protein n=1 Tax=Erythrobacter alti TaxID=1896145 RepID=UPI0030F3C145